MSISSKQVISAFSPEALLVRPDQSIAECAGLMREMCIGFLVIEEKHRPAAVISERDIVFKVAAEGKNPEDVKVSEIMTQYVVTISQEASLFEAWQTMNNHQIRHLVVVDAEERTSGILSVRDIVTRLAMEQEVNGLLGNLDIDILDVNRVTNPND